MSEIAPPPLDAAGSLACANCKRPVGPVHYRVLGRAACPDCARLIASITDFNRFAAGPFFTGAQAGFGAAIAVAGVWALIAKSTGYSGGLIAIFMGTIVSYSVLKGSGGRRGAHMQALSIMMSLFGIWLGKGLCATWSFYRFFDPIVTQSGEPPVLAHTRLLIFGFIYMFSPFDLLWYGFAVYDSWRRLRPVKIVVEGPFSAQPAASPGGLQFDSAEAAHTASAVRPPQ